MALVVLEVVLLRSVPMYPALGVCVCCTGLLVIFALYIKRGKILFRYGTDVRGVELIAYKRELHTSNLNTKTLLAT